MGNREAVMGRRGTDRIANGQEKVGPLNFQTVVASTLSVIKLQILKA